MTQRTVNAVVSMSNPNPCVSMFHPSSCHFHVFVLTLLVTPSHRNPAPHPVNPLLLKRQNTARHRIVTAVHRSNYVTLCHLVAVVALLESYWEKEDNAVAMACNWHHLCELNLVIDFV